MDTYIHLTEAILSGISIVSGFFVLLMYRMVSKKKSEDYRSPCKSFCATQCSQIRCSLLASSS